MIASLRTIRALASAALLALATIWSSPAAAQLNFDDVAPNANGVNNVRLNTPYQGFSFENFTVGGPGLVGTGANASSGTRFALGQVDAGFIYRLDNLRFDLFDAFLSFRAFDANVSPVMITVNGYRGAGANPVFTRVLALTNQAELFTLNFTNVDEIEFDTGALATGRASALALDDANIAVVPAPASMVLFATGAVLLVGVARQRRMA